MNREALPTSNQPLMSATAIPTIPVGTTYHRLENGLEIIVREDRSAPVVSAQAWCRAGSIDEGAWMGAGLSHVLEHMLFKGTSTRGAGRIDQEVQAAGGYMNAYTSFDRTVYWISVPNTGATVAIDILCDIFQNATLPAEELVKELDVIRREMAMGNDDPSRRASRGLFETAYKVSPYRYPIIGLPDIFNRVTREDLVSYYTQKYAPNNCFFVVVGDIRPEAAVAQIREAFATPSPRNPSKRHPAKLWKRLRSNWGISTLPGTSPICVIRRPRFSTYWPLCWAADVRPGCTGRCAKRRGSSTRSMLGFTRRVPPVFSA